ncbi:4'-phosphopantetheinyl transferase superfamily protein [Streptomyces sp. NPDC002793]|uniref:4'-phosphopantetheinyl transferase family protein n=1 Tax=Streptomyces sp. NPDC002793 TaxID=3154432 RepID=UPI0033257E6B
MSAGVPAAAVRAVWSPVVDRPAVRALLDEEERDRYAALWSAGDRARFATGRALARRVLGRLMGAPAESLRFTRTCRHCGGPHGAPQLTGDRPRPRFSLSHTADVVVLAVCDRGTPGVDVERPGSRDFARLAGRVLSATEAEDFSGLLPGRLDRAGCRYWTRKEALLKATGHGLTLPMREITVTRPDREAGLVDWSGRYEASEFGLADLRGGQATGCVAALAVHGVPGVEVTEFSVDDPLDDPADFS